jgi:hypothetical protein
MWRGFELRMMTYFKNRNVYSLIEIHSDMLRDVLILAKLQVIGISSLHVVGYTLGL